VKLHITTDPNLLYVSGYGSGYIAIGERHFHNTLLLTPERILTRPGVDSVQALVPGALPMLSELAAEILLIGTGSAQRAPAPDFIADLAIRRIGVEYMDTPAACRTFNILVAEQRRVAALLFIEN